MKKKKILISVVLLIICFFIATNTMSQSQQKDVLTEEDVKKIDPRNVEKQKIERKTGGETPKEEKIEIKEEPEQPQQEIIIRKYKPGNLFIESSGFKMGTSLTPPQQQQSQQQTTQQTTQQKNVQTQSKEFKGYCESVNDYKITLYPVPGELKCFIKSLSNEQIKISGKFKPNVGESSLTFEVSKISVCNQVKDFYIVKASDYSPNLYSDINRKIIENAMLKFFSKTGSDVSSGVVERLKEPETRMSILSESGVTIVDEQKQKTWKDFSETIPYLAGANLTDALSKEILSAYNGRIPTIFYVNKGEMFMVEGICVNINQ